MVPACCNSSVSLANFHCSLLSTLQSKHRFPKHVLQNIFLFTIHNMLDTAKAKHVMCNILSSEAWNFIQHQSVEIFRRFNFKPFFPQTKQKQQISSLL